MDFPHHYSPRASWKTRIQRRTDRIHVKLNFLLVEYTQY